MLNIRWFAQDIAIGRDNIRIHTQDPPRAATRHLFGFTLCGALYVLLAVSIVGKSSLVKTAD